MRVSGRHTAPLLALLAACGSWDSPAPTLERHDAWLALKNLPLLAERPADAAELALALSRRIGVAVEPEQRFSPPLGPHLLWLREPPGSSSELPFAWGPDQPFAALLENAHGRFDGDRDIAWLWAFGDREGRGARVFVLLARDPEKVPVERLRVERTCGAGFQTFRDGDPVAHGALRWRPEAEGYSLEPDPQHPPLDPVGAFKRRAARHPGRGFVLFSDADRRDRRVLAAHDHLEKLCSQLPLDLAPPAIEVWLIEDRLLMRRLAGEELLRHANPIAGRLYWLARGDRFALPGGFLPDGFLFQQLRLQRAFGDTAPSWWIEGLATATSFMAPLLTETGIWSALARWEGCPGVDELLDEERYRAIDPWTRRPLAALIATRLTAVCPDLAAQLQLLTGRRDPTAFLAAVLKEARADLRASVGHAQPQARGAVGFRRGVSIEPRFPAGYRDDGYRRALVRARQLKANLVVLTSYCGSGALLDIPSRLEPQDRSALEEAITRARAMGFAVRLRVRLDLVRIGHLFGYLWQSDQAFWRRDFPRLRSLLVEHALMCRALGVSELALGGATTASFRGYISERRKGRDVHNLLATHWHTALRELKEVWDGRILFELRDPYVIPALDFCDFIDAVALENRSAHRSAEPQGSALGPLIASSRRRLQSGRLRSLARSFAKLVAADAREGGIAASELNLSVHGHHLACALPDRYLEGEDDALKWMLLDSLLEAAWTQPAIHGVVLSGGELDGGAGSLSNGFAAPQLSAIVARFFSRPAAHEVLGERGPWGAFLDALRRTISHIPPR